MTDQIPGMFVMSVTPFDEDDRLDEEALRRHLRRMADAGVGVYLGSPGTGEGHTLSREERLRLFEIGVEELKGRVPVRAAGLEPRSAQGLIEVARDAEAAGLESVTLYPVDGGHGYRPRGVELEVYFDDLLTAIKMPVVIYSHAAVGYEVPIDLLARLTARYERIVAINFSAGRPNLPYLVKLIDALATKVPIYWGGMEHLAATLSLGGHGCVAAEPNLVPRLCSAVVQDYRAGRYETALGSLAKLFRLDAALSPFGPASTRPYKAAMRVLGLPGGRPRKPYLFPSEPEQRQLARDLGAIGIEELSGASV